MGSPRKIREAELEVLREIVREQPTASEEEMRQALAARTGVVVVRSAIRKALRRAGIERKRAPARVDAETSGEVVSGEAPSPRYGYESSHRGQAPEQRYPSSLTDAEWEWVHDIFERPASRGHPGHYSRRSLVDACCYVVRTGCSWRELPNDFPPWQNVYGTFRRWQQQGRFEQMHDRLRAQWRAREGRASEPSAGALDAQSTRHSPQGGCSGFDAGKKVKGRKRHVLTDTLGLILAVSVTAASVSDPAGAHPVMASAVSKYPSLQTVFVDSAYAGRCVQTARDQLGVELQVIRHPADRNVGQRYVADQADLFEAQSIPRGFVALPKRWVVERTHAWLERARRLTMHHDRRTEVAETWVWLAQARMLLRRLTVKA